MPPHPPIVIASTCGVKAPKAAAASKGAAPAAGVCVYVCACMYVCVFVCVCVFLARRVLILRVFASGGAGSEPVVATMKSIVGRAINTVSTAVRSEVVPALPELLSQYIVVSAACLVRAARRWHY